MSFGDLLSSSSSPPVHVPSTEVTPSSPANTELQRLLKPLSLNNAALRETTVQLAQQRDNPSASTLKRMRALRDQNRHIAGAAASLITDTDVYMASEHHSRTQLKSLLDDFSSAVVKSVNVERKVINHLQEQDIDISSFLATASNASSLTSSPVITSAHPFVQHNANNLGGNTSLIDANKLVLTPASSSSNLSSLFQNSNNAESTPLVNHKSFNYSSTVINDDDDDDDDNFERQQQVQRSTYREADLSEGFLAEKHATLKQIQSSVDDVNAIFKDLAVMVGDQGAQVDYIEVAMSDSAAQVEMARKQLEKTRQRRNARKSLFFCTLFIIAFIIAIFLIILLT